MYYEILKPLTLYGTHVSTQQSPLTDLSSNAAHVNDSTVCVTMLIACLALSRWHVGSRIKWLVYTAHSCRAAAAAANDNALSVCVLDKAPPIIHILPIYLFIHCSSSSSNSIADTISTQFFFILILYAYTLQSKVPTRYNC